MIGDRYVAQNTVVKRKVSMKQRGANGLKQYNNIKATYENAEILQMTIRSARSAHAYEPMLTSR